VLEHRSPVHRVEPAEISEVPLGEGPPSVVGKVAGVDPPLAGNNGAKGPRVVRAHTVEIDAEDEPAVSATQNDAPTKPRAASMNRKSFGVAK
jgi:uncharacterized protein (UPF0264 family)